MEYYDVVVKWFDIVWFWFGRIIGGCFSVALIIAVIASVVDWCFGKIKSLVLFYQFLQWKRNPETLARIREERDASIKECEKFKAMSSRYIDAYMNMKQFAIDNGLDVTTSNLPDPTKKGE